MGIIQSFFGKKVETVNNYEHLPNELKKNVLNASIVYNKYGAYCVPLSSQHRTLNQRILKGEVFEPDTIQFLCDKAGEGDIIHAGTCFGDFLPAISKAIHKDAHVWAFEPNSENYRCAQITVTLNNLSNVHLINAGLGGMTSLTQMRVTDNRGRGLGGSSRILKPFEKQIKTETINMVSLDEVIPSDRQISIVQLDVEGHEEQALKGARELIERCRPILVLENDHGIINSSWFKKSILSKGYEVGAKLHYNRVVSPI